ncbi:AraC family transcriptional regulator [Paenibacillus sp. Marseille-Q4541]|uniref:helix-turn-helix domain-containing protein n=1 Tax=Paenibacillus sp. Marseille-Q4541 TaxID=2831522 RepID=UPI001BAB70E2|nr:AraC family transcriptional regulator [Paenibacillus sp. Marseille-Q4541]
MPRKKKPVIEYRHYSLPIHFPILLLSGERWKISDIKSNHLHFHNHLEIGICHSDSGFMEIKGESVPFKAGDVTFIPRYLPHTTYSSPNTASLWSYLFFSPEDLFKHSFKGAYHNFEPNLWMLKGTNCILSKEKHPKIYTLATSVVEELKQQNSYYQESAYGLLLSLYIELLRIYSMNEPLENQESEHKQKDDFVISPVLEYITKHYMKPITIDFLADLCHLSTTHFRRKFHEMMGTAPLDFLNSTRIEEACKKLKSTDDSILSISEQVGFQSISSFNRCFSKLKGESPKQWRKGARAGAQSTKASILEFTGWV